ncbi:MAG: hypothetical protein MK100_04190 [Phycisphaerales bacterium]|nr:hypothetical protein [Phycisphaerales bacterium]
MKHRVVVTESLHEDSIAWLEDRAEVVQCPSTAPEFQEAIAPASGLIVRTYTQVDQAMLSMAQNLRVVGRAGTGLDNIDLQACQDRGVEVVHTPAANRQAVIEYVVSLIMSEVRPVPPAVPGGLTPDTWAAARAAAMTTRQLSERRVGILGFGQIGRRVSAVMESMGAAVQYHDLLTIPSELRGRAEPVSLEALLEESDILSIHVDGRPENRHFLGADRLALLRPEVLLINTARGLVIDNAALASVLEGHSGRRAILDVHEEEPVPADDPLLGLSGVTLLPHAACRTIAAQKGMSDVVQEVWTALEPGDRGS